MKKILINFSKKMRTGTPDSGCVLSVGYEVTKGELKNIHKAAWKGNLAKIERLAKSSDINKVDQQNRTPLHLACANGHARVVRFLVEKKANLNLGDNHNRTALMKAVQGQHEQCVNILLENNANPNLVDAGGNTALHLASSFSSISTVILLLKKGVDIDPTNLEGLSPLALAVQEDYVKMAEFLLNRGADVNHLDNHQRSPLMIAAANECVDMVRLLLQFDADTTLTDNTGKSAEDYAETNQPCALLIIEHDAQSSQANCSSRPCSSKQTPLKTGIAPAGPFLGIQFSIPEPTYGLDSIGAHAQIENQIQQEENKCEGEHQKQTDLMEELGLGALDSIPDSSDADTSSNSSRRSLPVCTEGSPPKEVPERSSPSAEQVVAAIPEAIGSDESIWDQDSSSSSCGETNDDNQQPQATPGADFPEPAREEKGHLQSDEQQVHEEETKTEDEKLSKKVEKSEGKSIFSNFFGAIKGTLGKPSKPETNPEEKQFGSSSSKEDSIDMEEGQTRQLSPEGKNRVLLDEHKQGDFECEDSFSASVDNSMSKEKKPSVSLSAVPQFQQPQEPLPSEEKPSFSLSHLFLFQKPQEPLPSEEKPSVCLSPVPLFQQPREPLPSESPPPRSAKKENIAVCATPVPCHNQQMSINQKELEAAQRTAKIVSMTNPNVSSDTSGSSEEAAEADEEPVRLSQTEASRQVEKPVTSERGLVQSSLAGQLIFDPSRPGGQSLEECSQLTVVSEACCIPKSSYGINRDLEFDNILNDLSEDDTSRWQIKRQNTNLNTEELFEDTDELISSSEETLAIVQMLEEATADSISKKKVQDMFHERSVRKEKGHQVLITEKMQQHICALEEKNLQLESEVAHMSLQLKRKQETVMLYRSANEQLEEDHKPNQMQWPLDSKRLKTQLQESHCEKIKFQEIQEEYKRSKNNEEHLRTELEHLQTNSNSRQTDLVKENESLKEQLEDVRQDLKLAIDNQSHSELDWNAKNQELMCAVSLANNLLEKEKKACEVLVAETQAISSSLAEVEQARSDLEKALHLEKEERHRLESEAHSHREVVTKLYQKLTKAKANAGNLESEVRKLEVQIAEKTLHLNAVQHENDQIGARVKELEAALQAEKEVATRTVARQGSTQELLNQAQNDSKLFQQRLEEAQNKAIANEKALTDAQKSFNNSFSKLQADRDDRLQQMQEKNKELASKAAENENHIRKLEQEKNEKQTYQRQMQQDMAEMSKNLSKCEASLEIATTYRRDLEEEKARLIKEIDKLKGKLEEREAQCFQAERNKNDRMIQMDEREKEISVAARKQKEAQAAVDAANDIVQQLEETTHRLEIENIRLKASANQHCHKFEALQKVAQEDARIRVQLEELVTNLQSSKITLEDQLNKEVQRQSLLTSNAQDSHAMWKEEMKSRSKLGLRFAELEKEQKELNNQVELEMKKTENIEEQKRAVDLRLEQEMKRNSDLQKEMYRLQSLLKTAKRKLQDHQTSGVEKEKIYHQLNELQAELEREMSSRGQLEKIKRQLEEEVISLKRSQEPPVDVGAQAPTGNALNTQGAQNCQCSKKISPVTCTVEDYLNKMRQDLEIAMSRELGMREYSNEAKHWVYPKSGPRANSLVRLDKSSGRMSPVSRARQEYANILKRNHEV
ncbi:ankyrin repeat domain-containing protein 26-like isoform X2 [Entelurus aequoreus]|uniref:ankyrin repeat domain-containing protein 26-like isoform X2 n=1 Tax=Entelurus aequoreus TaxID=161455 RepID=UPI002B1DE971|nr:ankyrin repeat domain-containing protein 26-like isoform X2 [Entelurus aequoreus]